MKNQKELSNQEFAQALWQCSVIFYDKNGNKLGWFPCEEASDYETRALIAKNNGLEEWHLCALFHTVKLDGVMYGQIKGEKDKVCEISLLTGKVSK